MMIFGWTLETVSESIVLIHLLFAQIQVAIGTVIHHIQHVADTVVRHTVTATSATSEIIFHHCLREQRESEFDTLQLVSIRILFGHFLEVRSTISIRIVVSSLKLQGHLMDDLSRRVQSALQNLSMSPQRLPGRKLLNNEMIASAIFPESSCYNLSNCASNWAPRFMTERLYSCILVPYSLFTKSR